MSLLLAATGPTPVDEVWGRYSTPDRWVEWAPQIRSVSCSGPLVPGMSGTVHGPWPMRIPFEIRSVDATARVWSWRVGVGPLGVVMDHGVEASGSGARAWVRLHAPTPLVAPYAPVARLALRRLVS
jgi:hypothetical protein